ncbi:hypothetical protein [uncultured Imperialibacter sp.]|uniref:hypothetical protein n=1 Tax=uncultured Imperialibacter sp. TaxID=1672639 RepID=UPI0030DA539E|tara:strand:- start:215507 stop:216595 length:1089 start_codon:yes stop_codon:yes gene_type:complete
MPSQDVVVQSAIQSIFEKINPVSSKQNFWLIRTDTGAMYDEFLSTSSVGISHSEFYPPELLRLGRAFRDSDGSFVIPEIKKQLKSLLKSKYKHRYDEVTKHYGIGSAEYNSLEYTINLTASQIVRFVFEMKEGDIVVIPSYRSEYAAIGLVRETALSDRRAGAFILRKDVKWEKTLERVDLDANFHSVFKAHQAINNITPYRDIILRTLYDFYIDSGNANLVLNVATQGRINAMEFYEFGYSFLKLCDQFFLEYNLPYRASDIDLILNLNSPGKIKFFSAAKVSLVAVSVLYVLTIGGGGEVSLGNMNLKVQTDGLLKAWTDFQNESQRREIVDKVLENSDSLEIKRPEDFIKILDQLDTKK